MARKKKTRLSRKRNLDKKENVETPDGLSAQMFAALPQVYGSFTTKDSNDNLLEFSDGDVAYIQHQDVEDDVEVPEKDYWIGEIQEIRGNDADDVWVRVQWFWSPQEVAEVINSFDPTVCGEYEKLSSDTVDIISVHCFVAHAHVKSFEETSIYQVFIGEEEWYTRYNFLYCGRRISPKVSHVACSICKIPYTPGKEKILHFCPRPGCRRFYHQSCLVKNSYAEKTRAHRVLETWPDVDRTVTVDALYDVHPPRKRQKQNDSTSRRQSDPLEGFPAKLVAVAEQQIVRGTQGGGIVGNITSVVAARHLIYRTLGVGGPVPDGWGTTVDVSLVSSETSSFPNCICPSCLSPI